MPLWNSPTSHVEVIHLFSEGRAQLGSTTAKRPTSFARAIARAGTAKNISGFVRYGYMKRLGGMYFQAIPLGRWQVTPQPRQDLLDDLDQFRWLELVQRAARDKFAPRSFVTAQRNLESAIMAVCARGGDSDLWQTLLLALADIEQRMVRSPSFAAKQRLRPIPPLRAGWLHAAGRDSSSELRLAVALALQTTDAKGRDSIRRHWLPLDPKKPSQFAVDSTGLRRDPGVVCHGTNAETDLLALIQRRAVEGPRTDSRHFSLHGHPSFSATLPDLAALIVGTIDLDKTTRLARALMAVRRPKVIAMIDVTRGKPDIEPPPIYGLFRLVCLPVSLKRGAGDVPIPFDPAIPARLATGDLTTAGAAALRRLRAANLRPVIRHIVGTPDFARRLALSIAFPVSAGTASRLADTLTKPQPEKSSHEA
jgi:CRISPR-associated protein Csx17